MVSVPIRVIIASKSWKNTSILVIFKEKIFFFWILSTKWLSTFWSRFSGWNLEHIKAIIGKKKNHFLSMALIKVTFLSLRKINGAAAFVVKPKTNSWMTWKRFSRRLVCDFFSGNSRLLLLWVVALKSIKTFLSKLSREVLGLVGCKIKPQSSGTTKKLKKLSSNILGLIFWIFRTFFSSDSKFRVFEKKF